MESAEKRLDTFLQWSPFTRQRPFDLAEAWFFYTGEDDHVKCAFCGVGIFDWKCGDIPLLEHMKYSKNCPFIQGYDVGNIPLYDDPIRGKYLMLPSFDVCGNWNEEKQRPEEPKKSWWKNFFDRPFFDYDDEDDDNFKLI